MNPLTKAALKARWRMGRARHAGTDTDIERMDATELSIQGAEEIADAVHYLRRVQTGYMQGLADRAELLLDLVPDGILREVARRADQEVPDGD